MMNALDDAEKTGFVVESLQVDKSDVICLDGKNFPKYIAPPAFIKGPVVYKSSYSPEYEDYKQLFRCHAPESDFYIAYPSRSRNAKPIQTTPVNCPSRLKVTNAFSSTYKEEVETFIAQLYALLNKYTITNNSNLNSLKQDILLLTNKVAKCTENATLDNVNSLRILHAELLYKYEASLTN